MIPMTSTGFDQVFTDSSEEPERERTSPIEAPFKKPAKGILNSLAHNGKYTSTWAHDGYTVRA